MRYLCSCRTAYLHTYHTIHECFHNRYTGVCVYIYIYIYIHVYMCVHIHAHTHNLSLSLSLSLSHRCIYAAHDKQTREETDLGGSLLREEGGHTARVRRDDEHAKESMRAENDFAANGDRRLIRAAEHAREHLRRKSECACMHRQRHEACWDAQLRTRVAPALVLSCLSVPVASRRFNACMHACIFHVVTE
jgi:hypothetical protein